VRDLEPVAGLAQHRQTLARPGGKRRLIQQHATAAGRPPANAAPKLMQLGEPHALGVFDDHQAGSGNIHPDLDHGGRNQNVDLTALECPHGGLLLARPHAPVHQSQTKPG